MRSRSRRAAVLLACMTLLGLSPASAQEAAPPQVVLVQEIKTQQIRPGFEHPARIEAINTHSARAYIKARIIAMNITAGAIVEKGDLLVELDPTDSQIALAQAHANLKEAEANAVKISLDLDRAQRLVASNTVSQRELEYAQTQSEVADAQVEIARQQIKQAEQNLTYTKIYAPFKGRISAPNYAVGDIYIPADPTSPAPIAEIVQLDPIYAVGLVDQSNYFSFLDNRLKLQEAGKSIPPLKLEIVLPGGTVYPEVGTFENWDNTAVPSTGTIAARIILPNPNGVLLPGENVTVRGEVINAVNAPLVPQRAVSFDQIGYYVWVVTDGTTVERRNIEVGIRYQEDWTVGEGLADGDVVVVEGLQKMRPGLTVSPQPFES
jgi:RND family efflux transporter MFP subunit